MWVEQTKKGKYKFIERYTDPLTGKYKRVSVTLDKDTPQSRKRAQKAISKKIEDAEKTVVEKSEDMTLGSLVELYREEQKHTVKASTYQRNYFACETLKNILGSDTRLKNLTAGYIRKSFLSTGKKHGTLNEHLTRLKSLIRWGFRNDYVDDITFLDKLDPFSDIPHREKIENKFLESTEVSILIRGMELQKWKNLTLFLVLSGLRFGEAAALERSDLDFKKRVIHITKNYDSVNKIVTTPKTRTSIRDVYMQDELYALCKRLAAESVSNTIVSLSFKSLIFTDDIGEHVSFFTYNKYLRQISIKELGRAITPHTLRHTHASLMMENGMNEDSISRRLGHTNSKITKEIYLHATNKLKEKENSQIKGIKIL